MNIETALKLWRETTHFLWQGKRYSLANSRIMIHQPLGGAQGQAADIEIQANEILHHKLTLNGYLAEFTGQGMERITQDTGQSFSSRFMCLIMPLHRCSWRLLLHMQWSCLDIGSATSLTGD